MNNINEIQSLCISIITLSLVVIHKCFDLVMKHQFLEIKMDSIFHNIIISIYVKQL